MFQLLFTGMKANIAIRLLFMTFLQQVYNLWKFLQCCEKTAVDELRTRTLDFLQIPVDARYRAEL